MKISGRCHCGAITYEAEVNMDNVGICHCTDCQTLSGSAFRTVVLTEPGSFQLHAGSPKIYMKTGESGAKREQAFCSECGSPIYSAAPGDAPKVHSIRLGTVTQRYELLPKFQIWHRSSQRWLNELSSIPAKAKQ
ncbi:MAG: aldehyde-activating protein [marine bacterium B5-7]|nr:MAG: aldehyde-activating protein [marine bacterium B5-7]